MSEQNSWSWVREAYQATPAADPGMAQRVAERIAVELTQKPATATPHPRTLSAKRVAPWIAGLAAATLVVVVAGRGGSAGDPNAQAVVTAKDSDTAASPSRLMDAALNDSVPRQMDRGRRIATTELSAQRRPEAATATDRSTSAVTATPTEPNVRADSIRSVSPTTVASAAGIDARSSAILRERMSETSFSRFATLIDSATNERLPAAPIIDRAVQGARRGLSEDVVLRAAAAVRDRLSTARAALGATSTSDELTAAAEALFAGVAPATLSQVRQSRTPGSTVVPLIVLTDLVTSGVPVADATAAVLSLVDRSNTTSGALTDETMLAIRAEVAADVAGGVAPATALSSRVRSHTDARQAPARPASPIPPRPSPTTRPPGGL